MMWYMNQDVKAGEEFKRTPKKQELYNWLMSALESISSRDVIKSFLTSGISISMNGDEDQLSTNVLRLKKQAKEEEIILSKDDPLDLKEFFSNDYEEEENSKAFISKYYDKFNEDEEELVVDENLDNFIDMLTSRLKKIMKTTFR